MSELKPCPFCGGKAHIHNSVVGIWWYACDQCKAETRASSYKSDALEIWNRRSAIDPYSMHICGTCSSESGAECTRRNCHLNNAWEPKTAQNTFYGLSECAGRSKATEPAHDNGKPEPGDLVISASSQAVQWNGLPDPWYWAPEDTKTMEDETIVVLMRAAEVKRRIDEATP